MAFLHVLLAGECGNKLGQLAAALADLGYDTTMVTGRVATMQCLFSSIYDVVVLDESIADAHCPHWLHQIKVLSPQSQIIRLTATNGKTDAVTLQCPQSMEIFEQLPCPVTAQQLSRSILNACTCGHHAQPGLHSTG